jgi:hypothetical protein
MFWKTKLSEDFVELPQGKVYFKELTNGIVNECMTLASLKGGAVNNNHFYRCLEYKLLNLSNKKINALTPRQGNKVREKLKEILLRHEVITEDSGFSEMEKQQLGEMLQSSLQNLMSNK